MSIAATKEKRHPDPVPRLPAKPGPREIARLRRAILRAWHSHLSKTEKPETKDMATREFCQLFNAGLLLPEGFSKSIRISKSTLHSWNKVFLGRGLDGLVPKYKWKGRARDNLVPMLPSHKKITIPGNPNLRFKARTYWPEIRRQWRWPPLHCPLMIVVFVSMEIPKGFPMRTRMRMLRHEFPHLGSPHLDKLIAFVKDCLRDIAYKEDCQIISLSVEKHYRWFPKTEIFIRRLKG